VLNEIKEVLKELDKDNYSFNFIDMSKDIINNLRDQKLVIYPAGINGQLLQKTLEKESIYIESFYDKAFDSLKSINNINVNKPENITLLNSEYILIISVNLDVQFDFFYKIVKEYNPNIEILNGKNLNRLLKSSSCLTKLETEEPFDLIECENCGFERKHCPIASRYLKRVGKHKKIKNDNRSKKFDWFGYIVSQNCSLKCEHCCEQVPYLNDKGFSSVEDIVSDVKKIAESSEFLNFVELIGGEPFLHPQIEELIEELLKIENIGYIKSFTNGTIVPSDKLCNIINNPRFMLQISNYELAAKGRLLANIFKTRSKLDKFGIRYLFTRNFEWLDFSSFDEHKSSIEYLKNAFNKCFLKNCHRVYKGKLYRCPHHYAGIQRNKLKEFSFECIDLHSYNKVALSGALENFEELEYIDACKYCDLAFDAKPVPAGKQIGD